MCHIYTSYFAKAKYFDRNKFILCQISNSAPLELDGKLSVLIPDWDTIVSPKKEGLIDEDEYRKRYINQLNSTKDSVLNVIRLLKTFNKSIILMCYESPDKFCHRHILADWYNTQTQDSELITEYQF